MKKWLCAASLGLALAASAGVQAADKVAVVNVASIFQQMPQREAIAKQLENEFKGRATELQKMEKDLQAKIQRLQSGGKSMKEAERQKLEKEVLAERDQFASKARALDEESRNRNMEERGKLIAKIQDVVKNVAKKEGYDVVFDANAAVYADPAKDITAEVLKQVK